MYPLITISEYQFSSYSILIFLALILSIACMKTLINFSSLENLDFPYYISLLLVSGFSGSKLFLLLEDFDFSFLYYKLTNIKNGYVLYGGLIFVFLSSYHYAKRKNIDKFLLLDINAISLSLGISIGKIACLSSGCCYGIPCSSQSIGLVYTNDLCPAFPKNEPLFPIQIIDSLFALTIFSLFLFLKLRNKIKKGRIFFMFFLIYPSYRFWSEQYRADASRGFIFDGMLSLSQFYSLLCFLLALILIVFHLNRKQDLRTA